MSTFKAFSGILLFACLLTAARGMNTQIVVAADGSGQFTSITQAIASVQIASEDKQVDIIIKPGKYVETIRTRDWVNLIGEDREKCIITYDSGATSNIHLYHTIWATSNTRIKNLTLIGGTVKYVIHSDGGRDYLLTLDHCTLRREYPNAKAKGYQAAFGIGLHADQHIEMKGCELDAILPIYMHNWNLQKGPCSMKLEKCALKGRDYAVIIANLGSKHADKFILQDCALEALKAGINYLNMRKIKTTSWFGEDEIKLSGTGNTLKGVTGTLTATGLTNLLAGAEAGAKTGP